MIFTPQSPKIGDKPYIADYIEKTSYFWYDRVVNNIKVNTMKKHHSHMPKLMKASSASSFVRREVFSTLPKGGAH